MKHLTALLLFGFLFKAPLIDVYIFSRGSCELKEHYSVVGVRVIPTGTVRLWLDEKDVMDVTIDKTVQEVHVKDGGKYTFFEYRNNIIYQVKDANCQPF